MTSPISARIPDELRQDLAKYCVEHDISQTQAIEAGLDLLLSQPSAASSLTPEQAAEGLAQLESELATKLAGFDPDAAKEDDRD